VVVEKKAEQEEEQEEEEEEEVDGAGRGYGGISNGNGMRGVCSMNFCTRISVHKTDVRFRCRS
jgi:hypothetical protein